MSNLRVGLCGKLAKSIGWSTFAPLDSDLSSGKSYPLFEQLEPGFCEFLFLPVSLRNNMTNGAATCYPLAWLILKQFFSNNFITLSDFTYARNVCRCIFRLS